MAAPIPVIDLSNPDRKANAKKLAEAMETIGFAYFDNIPGYSIEAEKAALRAIKWFFSLPSEKKMECSPKRWNENSKSIYKGYYPMAPPSIGILCEKFMFGDVPEDDPVVTSGIPFYEPPSLPNEDECDVPFRSTLVSHQKLMQKAGLEAVRLLAMEWGIDVEAFAAKFEPKPCSDLKPMHYPKQPSDGIPLLLKEHIDTGFVTLLSPLGYKGLEIKLDDGTWIDVAQRPGSIVVNIGDFWLVYLRDDLRPHATVCET
jgi:isopenicillin N synthase-like dioxygenase